MSFFRTVRKARWRVVLPIAFVALIAGATTSADEAPPDVLRIGDINFKVELKSFPDSFSAMTYFEKKVIRVDPSSTSTLRRKVYLHELMHVAWHDGKLPYDSQQTYTEDEAIESLVPGLLRILEQNPEVVQYLQHTKPSVNETISQQK
ncbi:MAG: hypothetical protein JWN45_338 [Acidobacteriaceae bacterium]|nr:hypothetical protein [Acidobacteriaceae bacterium]